MYQALNPRSFNFNLAGRVMWQEWRTYVCELSTRKRDQGAPKKRYKDQLKRELALAGVPHHSWQQAASSRDNWRTTVEDAAKAFERAAKERRIQRKERTSNQVITIPTHMSKLS